MSGEEVSSLFSESHLQGSCLKAGVNKDTCRRRATDSYAVGVQRKATLQDSRRKNGKIFLGISKESLKHHIRLALTLKYLSYVGH